MPKITEESELDAYYLNDPAHPRAAGVMSPAIVARRIDRLFETGLRPDQSVHNDLFQPTGALGNYAVKVRLAYLLGWIGADIYKDLLMIAKIRNRFAHVIEAKDFSDSKIHAWLQNMRCFQLIPDMIKRLQKRVEDDPIPQNKTLAFIAEVILADDISAFRFCIDQMLGHLEKCRANMVASLANTFRVTGLWQIPMLQSLTMAHHRHQG